MQVSTAAEYASTERYWQRALLRLSLIEMWERFSYYTMFSLLSLFLVTKVTEGGFGWPEADALRFFGLYMGIVQFTPLLGGMVTDRWLGNQRALMAGALLMTLGHFMMALPHLIRGTASLPKAEIIFETALLMLALGNGLFKPNISALIARLPHRSASERDAAFATFYMYINVGALLAGVACGYIAQRFGFHWAFTSAGLAMLISLVMMLAAGPRYVGPLSKAPVASDRMARPILGGPPPVSFLGPMLVVLAFALAFVIANYQLAGLVSVFTAAKVDRQFNTFQIPTSWFLALNPLAIILITPLLARLWRKPHSPLAAAGTAHKFAAGFLLVSASFLLLGGASLQAEAAVLASPYWIIGWVLVMTLGELLIGPVGTAAVSRLAPPHQQTIAMGALSAALGLGGWLSGKVGAAAANISTLSIYTAISAGALLCALSAWNARKWLERRGA